MNSVTLLLTIIVPAILALLVILLPGKLKAKNEWITVTGVAVNLFATIVLFGKDIQYLVPWSGFGIDFSLKLDRFSSFILLAASSFAFLIVVYSTVFMRGREFSTKFYAYLLFTVALLNGAVLANNLVVLLFFWEGFLVALFGMIMTGSRAAFPTAVKTLVLVGVSDLCMMLGIGMTGLLAGTLAMDKIRLPIESWGVFAFIFLMIGAISKAGSMPFHSWIPDAATNAPLPFMALLPAALEKLLGIYFLARIALELFDFKPGTPVSMVMMVIGAVTILLAVMMALIQKDFKRLLSYHAISQVGYMILGIGTALPIGIVGGLFHMINNAMYKSCLFLTGGSVEKQVGTTDLKDLGGLGRKMPVTFGCFIVTAAAISGVPPLNGFFSKELIFDAALESGWIFYAVAVLGAFFTAASFLKLGHSAFLGKPAKTADRVKEVPWPMLAPMIIIAAGCILFGVYNPLPINGLIQPVLGARLGGNDFAGLPQNWTLVGISVIILLLALLNHLYGVRKTNSGLGAVDHIHYAPGLSTIYGWAELRYFDPYDIGMLGVRGISRLFWRIDRGIDWIYNGFSVGVVRSLSSLLEKANTGSHSAYITWSLAGMAVIIIMIFAGWI